MGIGSWDHQSRPPRLITIRIPPPSATPLASGSRRRSRRRSRRVCRGWEPLQSWEMPPGVFSALPAPDATRIPVRSTPTSTPLLIPLVTMAPDFTPGPASTLARHFIHPATRPAPPAVSPNQVGLIHSFRSLFSLLVLTPDILNFQATYGGQEWRELVRQSFQGVFGGFNVGPSASRYFFPN